ncbi:unnamed protein product [Owenia fusiformis]|uniref:protein acetyllysine N-acetyltransferase n=1 Tax=Owenia fusiformis TaxID=6347 RepID=A0A8J1Y6D5_OWEFU|nr:unnamed protein product [Owenia fusiformis]
MADGPSRPTRNAKKCADLARILVKEEIRARSKQINVILKKEEEARTAEDNLVLEQSPDVVQSIQKRQNQRTVVKQRSLEIEDNEESLREKCEKLADAIRTAKHAIIYTGAGISTAASIPDYRGPNGVWTLLKEGKTPMCQDLSEAEPTLTHMCIVQLHKKKLVKYVVSQNCDGLHVRSGLPRESLSEVHGNMYLEQCAKCDNRDYFRLFDVTEKTGMRKHNTDRKCHKCRKNLRDTIIHFGEKGGLHTGPYNWEAASKHAEDADLILCLGSSLKVLRRYPCLWGMHKTQQKRPKLIVINLQWTPKDDIAHLKINGKCDEVMQLVMEYLHLRTPKYSKHKDALYKLAVPLRQREKNTTSKKILVKPETEPESDDEPDSGSEYDRGVSYDSNSQIGVLDNSNIAEGNTLHSLDNTRGKGPLVMGAKPRRKKCKLTENGASPEGTDSVTNTSALIDHNYIGSKQAKIDLADIVRNPDHIIDIKFNPHKVSGSDLNIEEKPSPSSQIQMNQIYYEYMHSTLSRQEPHASKPDKPQSFASNLAPPVSEPFIYNQYVAPPNVTAPSGADFMHVSSNFPPNVSITPNMNAKITPDMDITPNVTLTPNMNNMTIPISRHETRNVSLSLPKSATVTSNQLEQLVPKHEVQSTGTKKETMVDITRVPNSVFSKLGGKTKRTRPSTIRELLQQKASLSSENETVSSNSTQEVTPILETQSSVYKSEISSLDSHGGSSSDSFQTIKSLLLTHKDGTLSRPDDRQDLESQTGTPVCKTDENIARFLQAQQSYIAERIHAQSTSSIDVSSRPSSAASSSIGGLPSDLANVNPSTLTDPPIKDHLGPQYRILSPQTNGEFKSPFNIHQIPQGVHFGPLVQTTPSGVTSPPMNSPYMVSPVETPSPISVTGLPSPSPNVEKNFPFQMFFPNTFNTQKTFHSTVSSPHAQSGLASMVMSQNTPLPQHKLAQSGKMDQSKVEADDSKGVLGSNNTANIVNLVQMYTQNMARQLGLLSPPLAGISTVSIPGGNPNPHSQKQVQPQVPPSPGLSSPSSISPLGIPSPSKTMSPLPLHPNMVFNNMFMSSLSPYQEMIQMDKAMPSNTTEGRVCPEGKIPPESSNPSTPIKARVEIIKPTKVITPIVGNSPIVNPRANVDAVFKPISPDITETDIRKPSPALQMAAPSTSNQSSPRSKPRGREEKTKIIKTATKMTDDERLILKKIFGESFKVPDPPGPEPAKQRTNTKVRNSLIDPERMKTQFNASELTANEQKNTKHIASTTSEAVSNNVMPQMSKSASHIAAVAAPNVNIALLNINNAASNMNNSVPNTNKAASNINNAAQNMNNSTMSMNSAVQNINNAALNSTAQNWNNAAPNMNNAAPNMNNTVSPMDKISPAGNGRNSDISNSSLNVKPQLELNHVDFTVLKSTSEQLMASMSHASMYHASMGHASSTNHASMNHAPESHNRMTIDHASSMNHSSVDQANIQNNHSHTQYPISNIETSVLPSSTSVNANQHNANQLAKQPHNDTKQPCTSSGIVNDSDGDKQLNRKETSVGEVPAKQTVTSNRKRKANGAKNQKKSKDDEKAETPEPVLTTPGWFGQGYNPKKYKKKR